MSRMKKTLCFLVNILSGLVGLSAQEPGYTDRWIFIPCAGSRQGFHLEYDSEICLIWTSSLDTERFGAFSLSAGDSIKCLTSSRLLGYSIRPVCE